MNVFKIIFSFLYENSWHQSDLSGFYVVHTRIADLSVTPLAAVTPVTLIWLASYHIISRWHNFHMSFGSRTRNHELLTNFVQKFWRKFWDLKGKVVTVADRPWRLLWQTGFLLFNQVSIHQMDFLALIHAIYIYHQTKAVISAKIRWDIVYFESHKLHTNNISLRLLGDWMKNERWVWCRWKWDETYQTHM